ncbi:menaquinone biosynthesis family protein [Helicobacter cappadocius]|uniref:1,4-dihydroxy-6-naphtoate synthase n=1 Tax=Helicobacter cappadocius TaxID=3063998 RepID=A0AA90TEW8_9HELI|nr:MULTISPECIES: MqnA/MqnD/SBP family protein [unclassified Helicobacter]MDO7252965.1 MqnA/MqnD/SBP family protein [Helicobacter sp. faydin-H75]MDP2539045.1 MqnA/MqnD/SBP family protein [Helicobacter sp. faydin-H76]
MISVAHSPDADDLFMYYAIVFGWVDSSLGDRFSNVALDIQTLNEATIKGTYDVSAISFGVYPFVSDDFALLRTGVSFGQGYGPKLIKKKTTYLKKDFKVALSGRHTTNAIIFSLAYPNAKIVYKNFLEIEDAVLSGEVDAGVLIHESILNFNSELEVYREIWDVWCEQAGGELPLPLGGMALRRSIPLNKAIDIEATLTKAVNVAVKNKKTLSKMLMERGIIRVNEKELDTYLNLYANDDSISLSESQKKGIDRLFELGFKAGIYDKLIKCEDYFIPTEYKEIRNS